MRKRIPILACSLAAFIHMAAALATHASSHREAPFVAGLPRVDGTDFYLFNSYEPGRQGLVTLIANYQPFQDAFAGPEYFPLDPGALYRLHIDNTGDGVEDITFQLRVATTMRDLRLPVGGEEVSAPVLNLGPISGGGDRSVLNRLESYTLAVVRGPVDSPSRTMEYAVHPGSGRARFVKPVDDIGDKSIPDYATYAGGFVWSFAFPGCGDAQGRVFVGQRKDPFAVRLGAIFDLFDLDNPLGPRDAAGSDLEHHSVTTFALEVPAACLTAGNGPVIGGWTTAALRRNRILSDGPSTASPARETGDFVQVSRVGMPLVNSLVIGLVDKDRFNASRPRDSDPFLLYFTHPTLPEILEILFGPAGVRAPNRFPRTDLVSVFLTGLEGLNRFGQTAEMLRLNTAVPPVPASAQSDLGLLGGDLAGFPNGRRLGDDVMDVFLRLAMGALFHLHPGVFGGPQDAPSGNLPFTDGTTRAAARLPSAFPYLPAPERGVPEPPVLDFFLITGCTRLTSPGTYLLGSTLTTSDAGPCLVVAASDVTIDFQGNGLVHTAPAGGIAVGGEPGLRRIVLRNGFVRGFATAVQLLGTRDVAVAGMLFSEIEGHAVLLGGSCSVVDSAFDRIGDGRAIEAGVDFTASRNLFAAASLQCQRGCTVSESSFSGSSGAVVAGPASHIHDNTMYQVAGNAISIVFDGTLSGPASEIYRGDCLVVTTDLVTVDLAGFTIEQAAAEEKSVGIGGGRHGVAVRNGTIRGFGQAVDLGDFSTVTGMTFGPGQVSRNGAVVRVGRHCRLTGNRLLGSITGGSIMASRGLEFGRGCYVADNVLEPGAAAIGLSSSGPGSIVARNTVRHDPATSPEDGINLFTAEAVLVEGNTVELHPHLGLITGAGSLVLDNTLRGIPERTGFTASQGITAGQSSLIRGNDLSDLFASILTNGRCLVAGNTVRRARVHGITDAAGISASLITGNEVLGASESGIQIQGTNTLVQGNVLADTGGSAVRCAAAGPSAVRNNVATGSIGADVFAMCKDLGGNVRP